MPLDRYDLVTQAARAASQKGHEDYYQSNMAYLGRQFDLEQIRKVAEIGAQDLEQYGPEGKQWAQHLRTDPYAAYKMAELQGGFGEITSRLRYANALGTATTAEQQLQAAGEAYGLPAQIDLMKAQAALAENGVDKVYGTSKGQRPFRVVDGRIEYLPGFDERQALAEVDPRFFRPDAQGIIRDVRTGLPAFPNQSPMDQARWTDVRTSREEKVKDYDNLAKSAELLSIANADDPSWQRAVITITNKMLDSSAVMQGESEATAAAVRSQAGKIQNRIQQLATGQSDPLSPSEVRMVIAQARQMAARLLANAPNDLANWESENARMGGVSGQPLVEYATPREWADRATRASRTLSGDMAAEPKDITREQHEAAKQSLIEQGIPEELITPDMVVDLIEGTQGAAAPPVQEEPVPVTGPLTPAEIIRATQAKRRGGM